jgi:sugar phosphate isomerase/epimerase
MTCSALPWPLSAFATSLPGDLPGVLPQIAELGFTQVELPACEDRSTEDREALADSGLVVSCCSLIRGLRDEEMLDARDVDIRRATLERLCQRSNDAGQLGAACVYLIPGREASPAGLARFAEGCRLLAEHSSRRMMRLLIEPVPGRALPDVATTLAWLKPFQGKVGLLLDVGHCLISQEDPAQVIQQAHAVLGHVHLDDNDGRTDLHWPLLTGKLSEQTLYRTLQALHGVNYGGGLSLELRPNDSDPGQALSKSKAVVEQLGERGLSGP